MPKNASDLVAAAKEWSTRYGDYPNGVEGAALTALLRFQAAWDDNDPDRVAEVFTSDGSLLLGDEQLCGRADIHDYLQHSFAEGLGGSRWTHEIVEMDLLTPDVALAITRGGLAKSGEAVADDGRSMWVIAKRSGSWFLVSQQHSPIAG